MTYSRAEVEAARERLRMVASATVRDMFPSQARTIDDHIEALEAALREATPQLAAYAELLGEFDGPMYGPFPGGDPREFTPDDECCTPEEMAAWKAACEEWERGEGEDRGPGCWTMGDKTAWTGTGFGVGTTNHKSKNAEDVRILVTAAHALLPEARDECRCTPGESCPCAATCDCYARWVHTSVNGIWRNSGLTEQEEARDE